MPLLNLLVDLFVQVVLLTWSAAQAAPPLPPPPPVETTAVETYALTTPVVTAGAAEAYVSPPTVYEAPAVTGGGSLDAWLAASDWPSELWPTVRRLVACESGGNPAATNGHHEGLLQVDPDFWGHAPADPVAQLNQGYFVFLKQGWGAWECY